MPLSVLVSKPAPRRWPVSIIPDLIGVYDFGGGAGMLYIIMEFVPGKSLFHSAHGIAIAPGDVIKLVTGICNGLAHAHGIIHRHIKPSKWGLARIAKRCEPDPSRNDIYQQKFSRYLATARALAAIP